MWADLDSEIYIAQAIMIAATPRMAPICARGIQAQRMRAVQNEEHP